MVQMLTALACAGGLAAVFTTMLTGLKNTKDAARLAAGAGYRAIFITSSKEYPLVMTTLGKP